MKNFVIKYGSTVINLIAFVSLTGLIVSTVSIMMSQGFIASLTYCWLGLVSFIFVFFHIYLLMSVNEHLKNLDEKYNDKI